MQNDLCKKGWVTMNMTPRFFIRLVMAAAVLPLITTAVFAQARPKQKPLVGFEIGPKTDEIAAKQFIIDPPTIENLGFRWYVEGDNNRNAKVAVAFRKKGQTQWKNGLLMLRVHHEVSNQQYGPYRTGNLFAGSVLFLEPATSYEVRFTMSDPDGGAPTEPKIVTTSTRAEPKVADGRTIETIAEKGLMAAFEQAEPGDVILLRAAVPRALSSADARFTTSYTESIPDARIQGTGIFRTMRSSESTQHGIPDQGRPI